MIETIKPNKISNKENTTATLNKKTIVQLKELAVKHDIDTRYDKDGKRTVKTKQMLISDLIEIM